MNRLTLAIPAVIIVIAEDSASALQFRHSGM